MEFSRRVKNLVFPHHSNGRHPHLLRLEVALAVLACVALLEAGFVVRTLVFKNSNDQLAAVLPSVVIALTNSERVSKNLTALVPDDQLTQAAQTAADDMAKRGYFSHVSPDGALPWRWLFGAGYDYQYAGQNLAVNFNDSSELLSAWMESPTHRANILGQNYTQIGIGMATGTYKGAQAVFVVQFFGTPKKHPQSAAVAMTDETATPAGEVPTMWEMIESSPRTFTAVILGGFALFFAAVMLLSFLYFRKYPPRYGAVLCGVLVLVVLLGMIFANQHYVLNSVVVDQSAAVVKAR